MYASSENPTNVYSTLMPTKNAENLQQIQSLLAFSSEHSSEGAEVLLGDFNCSLPKGQIAGDFEASCQAVVDQGYLDPYSELINDCTFCGENSLTRNDPKLSLVLDHVFIRHDKIEVKKAARTYVETVSLEGTKTNLSDHFGVFVKAGL